MNVRPGLVVLDGGLATELEARGHDLSDRLWSARILLTEPGAIEDVHLAFFRAGARVATTASYQATIGGFEAAGVDRATALQAIRLSVELATRARDRAASESGRDDLLIAGSVGPYGAMLADGSEYRGDYDPGPAKLREVHGPRIEALIESGVDLLAIETIPTLHEAEVLADLVRETGARAWISYQCRDGTTTAAGETIADAVAAVAATPGVIAIGVNCTAPRFVPALLAAVRQAVPDRPLVAYPNGGDTWDPTTRRWITSDATGAYDATTVATWTQLGAAWLGGCCGVGPAGIAALAERLANPPDASRSLD